MSLAALYPANPAEIPLSVTQPGAEFKKQAVRVIVSILLFFIVYIILVIIAFVLAAVSVATILGAIAVSVWQYRGVMQPLQRLRAGVRSISAGHLEQRLGEESELEFAELTRDFNGMAKELNDLYHSLEQKVIAKSRELARSERLASVGFLAAGVAHEFVIAPYLFDEGFAVKGPAGVLGQEGK